MNCDVAVIGGGPGGSTLGTYLKLHKPELDVQIFERELFPRDHVGESQLPIISHYLNEMGVWDRIEAADFPIKIGATYKWGKTKKLWDFDFLPTSYPYQDRPRPDKFDGQRHFTAFQVDRAIYDKILLDFAEEKGCSVHQGVKVAKVNVEGDRVTGLGLDTGEAVTADTYIDASGHSGILRRAFDVDVEYPTNLQNIAVWDYWQNAEWAESIGVGGTRVQVMSLPYGWLWFIPLGPTRTSVGLVTPAVYYKQSGRRPEELYRQALEEEPRIAYLMRNAECENKLATTKDWSFLASRLYGENWYLVGESAGFADPILAAGLSITHASAREAAFTMLEIQRGKLDAKWLKDEYQRLQTNRVLNHIRFADYWYSANAQFEDLIDHTRKIAELNGLDLSPQKAWQWLGQGGFIDDDLNAGTGTLSLTAIKGLGECLTPMEVEHPLTKYNVLKMNLEGAKFIHRAAYEQGGVQQYDAYERDGKLLPLVGVYEVIVDILQKTSTLPGIGRELQALKLANPGNQLFKTYVLDRVPVAFEALIAGGWVVGSYDPKLPVAPINPHTPIKWHEDTNEALKKIDRKASG
ncbi:MAG TPA: NAD(P)/FAD-dependent oxidoreductase [Fimbriimonadaceae bacterium]|nr:NAD(P)/FAD-dependent oxidoreductase [Fimbriimonadaceae bacterium]